jgi:hypothetical protein
MQSDRQKTQNAQNGLERRLDSGSDAGLGEAFPTDGPTATPLIGCLMALVMKQTETEIEIAAEKKKEKNSE